MSSKKEVTTWFKEDFCASCKYCSPDAIDACVDGGHSGECFSAWLGETVTIGLNDGMKILQTMEVPRSVLVGLEQAAALLSQVSPLWWEEV